MHVIGIVLLIVQIALAVHAGKRGNYWWVFIILMFPLIGALVYLLMELLPSLQQVSHQAQRKVAKAIDPQRDLKERADKLQVTDNFDNKIALADECVTSGLADDAILLYQSALTGIYHDDPRALLGLARAYFLQENYRDTKATLARLIAENPAFKSADGHLLYARALEQLGEVPAALEEYAALASYYSGFEAKCRYALLLKRSGDVKAANAIFGDMLLNARRFGRFYKKRERVWVDIAQQELT